MLYPYLTKRIFTTLLAAEKNKKPIPLDEARKLWGKGSTWDDLVAGGYIQRTPEAVTVTKRGKGWLENHKDIK